MRYFVRLCINQIPVGQLRCANPGPHIIWFMKHAVVVSLVYPAASIVSYEHKPVKDRVIPSRPRSNDGHRNDGEDQNMGQAEPLVLPHIPEKYDAEKRK